MREGRPPLNCPISHLQDRPLVTPDLLPTVLLLCRHQGNRVIIWRMSLATNGSGPGKRARGDSSIDAVEKRGDSWKGRKVLASGFLELGFHNNASYSFSLGRPHLCELEAEICAFHPPYHGPINTHRPFLIVQE